MVELAVADEPGLTVDDRELRATGPSYTLSSLQSLRAELGSRVPLIMVVGMDAFLGLPAWHRWQELIQLAHILVVRRPGWHFAADEPMADWVRPFLVDEPGALKQAPAGRVLIHGLTPLGISATQIRERIAAGGSPRFLLPDAVWNYIRAQGLYSVRN
jgi:nicotinate-nucleotide adenylyltransferase